MTAPGPRPEPVPVRGRHRPRGGHTVEVFTRRRKHHGSAFIRPALARIGSPLAATLGQFAAVDGIYRVDGPGQFTVIADLGAWSSANPSNTPFFLPNGVMYAMQHYRGGLLVTDGHHNRVLWVTKDGEIREFRAFDNIVPTGLDVSGHTVYMAQAGAVPHLPEDGRVVAFGPKSADVAEVGSGAPLLVDVEFGRGRTLFALAQGQWDGAFPGSPAIPDDGSLVRVNADGTFTVVADGLDRPTSMEIIGNTAYVVTLTGTIVKLADIAGPPFGKRR